MTIPIILISLFLAAMIALAIHCNLWYYAIPKAERDKMDREMREW